MSLSIKVSELTVLPEITPDDYIIVNDSEGIPTTKKSTFSTLSSYLSASNVPVKSSSYSNHATNADYSLTSSYSISSSYAKKSDFSVSSSYASSSTSSSYSVSSSYSEQSDNAISSSYSLKSTSASFAEVAGGIGNAISASYSLTASYALTSSFSEVTNFLTYTGISNGTASYAIKALNADYATTSGYANSIPTNTPVNGDVTGTISNTTVQKIQNISVGNQVPQIGDFLYYNGTMWVPRNIAGGFATAWGYFDGVPTDLSNPNDTSMSGSCTIFSSYNVASIWRGNVPPTIVFRNPIGKYGITFSTPMNNINYMVVATGIQSNPDGGHATVSELWCRKTLDSENRVQTPHNYSDSEPYRLNLNPTPLNTLWLQALDADEDGYSEQIAYISFVVYGGL